MAEPVRRRLFLVWAVWIWLAWLISGELPTALRIIPVLCWQIVSPPWPGAWEAVRTMLLAALGAGLTAAACLGAGAAVLRIFGRDPAGSRLLALGAGIPALAMPAQAAGLLGLAHPFILAAVLAPAVSAAPLLLSLGGKRHYLADASKPLRLVVLGALLAAAFASLAPAVAWDEIVYHARVPSIYLYQHKIAPMPEIFPSFFPFSGEMLFMLAGNLGGDQAARLLHVFFWLAAGLSAAELARRLWGNKAGACTLGLTLTLQLGQIIAARAYVEFFLVLPFVGALTVILDKSGKNSGWKAPLAGWLAGAALGVKYLGAVYPVLFGALFIFCRPGRFRFAIFALFAAASCWYWPVRNILWTGNPVYPLIWGGPHWTSLDMAGWQTDARAFEFDVTALLILPWRLVMDRSGDGGISPLLPIGLAMPLLNRNWRDFRLWALLGSMLAIWWISAPLPRYLMPVLILLCILVSGHLTGKDLSPWAAKWIWRMTLAGMAGALLCSIGSIEAKTRPYGVALGKVTERQYREDYFLPEGYMEVLRELGNLVPPQGRVYFLGHLHSYPLARRTWFEFLYTRPALYWWLRGADNPARIRIRARQAGLTHIVYQPLGAKAILAPYPERMQWTKTSLEAYRTFWRRHVHRQRQIKNWTVYELVRQNHKPDKMESIPGTEGAH